MKNQQEVHSGKFQCHTNSDYVIYILIPELGCKWLQPGDKILFPSLRVTFRSSGASLDGSPNRTRNRLNWYWSANKQPRNVYSLVYPIFPFKHFSIYIIKLCYVPQKTHFQSNNTQSLLFFFFHTALSSKYLFSAKSSQSDPSLTLVGPEN